MPFRPCVGCGYCCKKVPCPLGVARQISFQAPCSFLRFEHGRHWCGLVVDEEDDRSRAIMVDDLAIGVGCCSPLNSDRLELLDRKERRG
jgi:hypothetical protein